MAVDIDNFSWCVVRSELWKYFILCSFHYYFSANLHTVVPVLLKFFLAFIEASNRGQMSSSIVMKNAEKTFEILKDFYQDEFIFNLLYVTKVNSVTEFLLSCGSKLEKLFSQKSMLLT